MYSERIINRDIDNAIQAKEVYYELNVGDGRKVKRFFEPTYHSIAEVDSSVSHLDLLRDPDAGKLTRALDEAEIAFIANERFLARISYPYYASRYGFIKNEQDRQVRYVPRISQEIFGDICAEHEEREIATALMVLKARQLGISREVSLRFGHRVIFYSGVNAVMASADPTKSTKLADMMEFVIDRLPWWLVPEPTLRRNGEYIIYGKQDSAITIEAGNQFNGIARGTTPTCCHLSELSEFEDAENLVDASLLRAMHDSPHLFLILESTAKGRGNWWANTWQSSKSGWPRGRSRLRPIFLPWFIGTDLYPTETWLRAHPIPSDWDIPSYVLHHAKAAEMYVRSNDLLRKYLGGNWIMPKAQMWWYEIEHDEAKVKNGLNNFLAEICSSDDEAFQSTNISVFDHETISTYRMKTRGIEPKGIYGFKAHESLIPLRLQPSLSHIDQQKDKIDITYPWGRDKIEFTLEPLKWQGYDAEDDGLGKLYIYEWPDGRSEYGIGVDTADGVGKDRSVLNGMRKGNVYTRPGQIFEFASDYVNAHDLWPMAACMASLYAVPFGNILKQPRMAIEIKGNGDTVQHELMKRGYTNFHKWYRIDTTTINPGKAHKLGVYTVQWFRSQMMDWLIKYLRDELIDIGSPFFVKEMESLEASEWTQGIKAAYGEHDDRIMSLGFVLVSMLQLEIQRGLNPDDLIPKQQEYAVFTPPDNGLKQAREKFLVQMAKGRPAARPAFGGVSRRYS